MLTIPERLGDHSELLRKMLGKFSSDLRVCMPGIIKDFNSEQLTCTVQPAIREKLNFKGNLQWVDLPELLNVPVVITGTADYFVTFPIVAGTECLVVFGDNCMDAWWQSGGVQNQIEKRRHDLSDGYAIIGPRSQVNLIKNYSTDSVQLRNKEGNAVLEIKEKTINIVSNVEVNLSAPKININSGSDKVVINDRVFLEHKHKDVEIWSARTGGVV